MPIAPDPVYLDLITPIKNVLLMQQMKREQEDRKIRNALLQEQLAGARNQNALFPMKLEAEKEKVRRQKEIDHLLKMPDDPDSIRTYAIEGEKLGIFKPAEHNKKRPTQWDEDEAFQWAKKTLGQGLNVSEKYETMFGAADKLKQKIAELKLPYGLGLKETPEQARRAKIETFKVGDEFVNAQWVGEKHKEEGLPAGYGKISEAPRYKPETKVSVITDQTLEREFLHKGVSLRGILRMSDEVTSMVGADATLIGTTGKIQRLIDSVSSQLKSAASKYTKDQAVVGGKIVSESKLMDPANYDWSKYAPEAAQSATIQSALIKMAYIVARSLNSEGLLSDKDVKNALDQIGGATGSPDQLKTVLGYVRQSSIQEYNDLASEMGKPTIVDIGTHKSGRKVMKLSDGTIKFLN